MIEKQIYLDVQRICYEVLTMAIKYGQSAVKLLLMRHERRMRFVKFGNTGNGLAHVTSHLSSRLYHSCTEDT